MQNKTCFIFRVMLILIIPLLLSASTISIPNSNLKDYAYEIKLNQKERNLAVMSEIIDTNHQLDDVWGKTFGGDEDDIGNSVKQATNGGYIIVGTTESYLSNSQIYLIKTDSDGNQIWEQTFGEIYNHHGEDVIQTSDGGYAIAGWLSIPGFTHIGILIKTDSNGNMDWYRYLMESDSYHNEKLYSLEQTLDGGFIITGNSLSYIDEGSYWWMDLWIVKTDASGFIEWTRNYGGYEYCDDVGYDIIQSSDGGYVIAGYTYQLGSFSSNAWLIKTDSNGLQEWNYISSKMMTSKSIVQVEDDCYIWAGENWLCKMTTGGNIQWKQEYPFDYNANKVLNLPDGGFTIVGDNTYITTDENGNLIHCGELLNCNFNGICLANLGYGVIVGSTTEYGAIKEDVLLLKGPLDWVTPEAKITSPLNGFYISNVKIIPLNNLTILIGNPLIKISSVDKYSGMEFVEIYVDDNLKEIIYSEPYHWKWFQIIPGRYKITIHAYDTVGNNAIDEIEVIKII